MVDKCYALADKWESQKVSDEVLLSRRLMPVWHNQANDRMSGFQALLFRY